MRQVTDRLDKIISFFVPDKYHKVVRYLISGGTAAATDLVLLYIFTSILHIWYLISAILAFIIAFVVSFILQKFWTFTDRSTERWRSQATIYFIITSTNLGLNTLLMYVFVDYFHIHYMISQFIVSGLIAIESYFIYQIFVFKKPRPDSEAPYSHEQ
jgi:putative flippase GtrA